MLETIRNAGGEQTSTLLQAGLADTDDDVRVAAANAAWAAGEQFRLEVEFGTPTWSMDSDAELRASLLTILMKDERVAVVAPSMAAIGAIYAPASAIESALVERYNPAAAPEIKETIVWLLATSKYASADVHALVKVARADAAPNVRGSATLATAMCDVPSAKGILEDMKRAETDPAVLNAVDAGLRYLAEN